jgi:hypothetical protein
MPSHLTDVEKTALAVCAYRTRALRLPLPRTTCMPAAAEEAQVLGIQAFDPSFDQSILDLVLAESGFDPGRLATGGQPVEWLMTVGGQGDRLTPLFLPHRHCWTFKCSMFVCGATALCFHAQRHNRNACSSCSPDFQV